MRRSIVQLCTIAAVLFAPPDSVYASLIGEIVHIGFPPVRGLGTGGDLIRRGQWMPVLVRLSLENEDSFDGWLRIAQLDTDGDRVFDIQPVHLRRGQTRDYWLYTTAGHARSRGWTVPVELLNRKNERVELLCRGEKARLITPAIAPEGVPYNDFLVLVVGRAVGAIVHLDHHGKLNRMPRITHIAPGELPDRWIGLAAVDAIIWDEADATQLNQQQIDALSVWIRAGGICVIASGPNALTLPPKLADLLPVELGELVTEDRLPSFRRNMLLLNVGREGISESYDRPITLVRCKAKASAETIHREPGLDLPLVVERRLGAGRVTFIAGDLADLLTDDAQLPRFFGRLFHLHDEPPSQVMNPTILADGIRGCVGFREIGAAYLAVAVMFAGAYVLIATFGSWTFLRMRGWLRHSWSVFAVIGVAASLVSVVAVQAVRGIGMSLHQVGIITVGANESAANAVAYFGLKSSMFGNYDVWLPADSLQDDRSLPSDCALLPMPPISVHTLNESYADPGKYRIVPTRAELLGVPIRGTVKQFQGHWFGHLTGRIRANISLVHGPDDSRYDVRISPDSEIANELGHDLDRVLIAYAAVDAYTELIPIPNWPRFVYIFDLGPMWAGNVLKPGQILFTEAGGGQRPFDFWRDEDLEHALDDWTKRLAGLNLARITGGNRKWVPYSNEQLNLLALTFFGRIISTETNTGWTRTGASFSAGSARALDLTPVLDGRTALFIGFSSNPGPVTLGVRNSGDDDYTTMKASQATTMYRVLIPIQ